MPLTVVWKGAILHPYFQKIATHFYAMCEENLYARYA